MTKKGSKSEPRYVLTHEEMQRELAELGRDGAVLTVKKDGFRYEGEALGRLAGLLEKLEEPLETLERRGVDFRLLVREHLTDAGKLPRYRAAVGADERWLADKAALDAYMEKQKAAAGEELPVADAALEETPAPGAAGALTVTDLHEVRTINETLGELKGLGVAPADLVPVGLRNGETVTAVRASRTPAARTASKACGIYSPRCGAWASGA